MMGWFTAFGSGLLWKSRTSAKTVSRRNAAVALIPLLKGATGWLPAAEWT
jgi:hypothetical protein